MRSTFERIADVVNAQGALFLDAAPPAMAEEMLPRLGSADREPREGDAFGVLYPRVLRRETSGDEMRRPSESSPAEGIRLAGSDPRRGEGAVTR